MAIHSDLSVLPDELVVELLVAFAAMRYWTDLEHHRQVAAEIIRQHLTVQFHAFAQAQLSH